jgi:hypothetical protein
MGWSSKPQHMGNFKVTKRNVTSQQIVAILKKNGTEIKLEEAEIILEFMYKLAKLSVDQFIRI